MCLETLWVCGYLGIVGMWILWVCGYCGYVGIVGMWVCGYSESKVKKPERRVEDGIEILDSKIYDLTELDASLGSGDEGGFGWT
jgi:hypothetical protein